MNIAEKLPRNVGSKIKFHFCHPNATIIQNYWREPEILKKNWLVAQLNRYNWLTHNPQIHNYGSNIYAPLWRKMVFDKNTPLSLKLKLHNILDPSGFSNGNGAIFVLGEYTFIIHNLRKIRKKIWGGKRIHYADHNEWKQRSLYGGVYSIIKRPKVYAPRNLLTGKWNLRWKRGGKLYKLCLKRWNRNPSRMGLWDGPGTIIRKMNGDEYVFMGILNPDFIPSRIGGIDPYI